MDASERTVGLLRSPLVGRGVFCLSISAPLVCRLADSSTTNTSQQANPRHQPPDAQIPQSHRHGRPSRLTSTVERRCWSPLWMSYSAPTPLTWCFYPASAGLALVSTTRFYPVAYSKSWRIFHTDDRHPSYYTYRDTRTSPLAGCSSSQLHRVLNNFLDVV